MGISFSKRAWRAQHLPDTEFAAEGEDTSTVNTKRLARFIKQGFLAPIWSREGEEDPENDHECPICFHHFPTLNSTTCCNQSICTECFLKLVQPQPGGSRYGSPCPFCNKVGFHVYYSPMALSQRKQLEAEEQMRVSETQLRSMLERQATNPSPTYPAGTPPSVVLRISPSQKPEWESWPEATPAAPMQDGSTDEGASVRDPGAAPLAEHVGHGQVLAAPTAAVLARQVQPGPGPESVGASHRRHRSWGPSPSVARCTPVLHRQSVGWHQLTGHGSNASLAGLASASSLGGIESAASVQDAGALEELLERESRPAGGEDAVARCGMSGGTEDAAAAARDSGVPPASHASTCQFPTLQPGPAESFTLHQTLRAGMALQEPADATPDVPHDVQVSAAFDPGRGGAVVVVDPDGSSLLYLLTCDALPEEERAALAAAADAVLTPQGLTTYNAPVSAYDDALRASIARADALLLARTAASSSQPGPDPAAADPVGWLERMAAADAALRASVEGSDRALFKPQ
ncbi:hypothetical protein ACKKBG_A03520 [Auxenochlorella protothecoides x Auxenochlorella symbiontica]